MSFFRKGEHIILNQTSSEGSGVTNESNAYFSLTCDVATVDVLERAVLLLLGEIGIDSKA